MSNLLCTCHICDAGKERDCSSENINSKGQTARENSDVNSVIKATFTFIFLSKMMKINWFDHFKYYADVPFNMK